MLPTWACFQFRLKQAGSCDTSCWQEAAEGTMRSMSVVSGVNCVSVRDSCVLSTWSNSTVGMQPLLLSCPHPLLLAGQKESATKYLLMLLLIYRE